MECNVFFRHFSIPKFFCKNLFSFVSVSKIPLWLRSQLLLQLNSRAWRLRDTIGLDWISFVAYSERHLQHSPLSFSASSLISESEFHLVLGFLHSFYTIKFGSHYPNLVFLSMLKYLSFQQIFVVLFTLSRLLPAWLPFITNILLVSYKN